MPPTETLRFTIVTCTWNSLHFLRQTVASVASQEYRNVEHVFVDGGSTDGTLDLIKSLSGDIKLIQDIDGGIARAMNAGIIAAAGDVIAHLHSDDYFAHPRVLTRVAKVFHDRDCEWMYGRTLTDLGGGWAPEAPTFHPYSYPRLLQGNIIPHPATYVRRRFFDKMGLFDESLRYAMDYDMWLRMGKVTAPVQIPEFLSVFRSHGRSATYANRLESFMEDHAVRKRYLGSNPLAQIHHGLRHLKRKRALQGLLAAEQKVRPLTRSD